MLYKEGKCSLEGIFSGMTDRSERVAAFLAVLELTKTGRILLNDDNTEVTFNTASDIDINENAVSEWETEERSGSTDEADG